MERPTLVDMVISGDSEDLVVDQAGRLIYHQAGDTEPHAVIRRAGTPDGGYARMVRVGNNAEVYNQTYWTELPEYISSSDLQDSEVQEQLIRAADQDGRITVLGFTGTKVDLNRYEYELFYNLKGDENASSITGVI